MFKLWLFFVILQLLLSVGVVFAKEHDVCKHEQKFSQIWYINGCDKNIEVEEVTTLYSGDHGKDEYWKLNNKKSYKNVTWSEIPEESNPNYELLEHYLKKYITYSDMNRPYTFRITPTNAKSFDYVIKEDTSVTKALNKTALLSYLMFEDGAIVIDQKSPVDRFGHLFNDETLYVSNSMGKSIQSYIVGHAVCRGHIGGIHEAMQWDILENTLYEGQPLLNVLNMSTGLNKYFKKHSSKFKKSKRWVNGISLESIFEQELKNSTAAKSAGKVYSYNNMNTNLLASYVLHKMGHEKYEEMLSEIFADKVGIQHDMVFYKPRGADVDEASITYGTFMTRYDYLRIAVAMLDDWNNNTCEGKYLKSLWDNKIKKNESYKFKNASFSNPKYYGGQFHMGMTGNKRPIFSIDGFGGQNIVIDFENNKIVSILAVHRNFNWMKLVHSKF
mgnify:FL=1